MNFDTYQTLKIKIIEKEQNPYVHINEDKTYDLFKGVDLDLYSATKESLSLLAKKFDTKPNMLVYESLKDIINSLKFNADNVNDFTNFEHKIVINLKNIDDKEFPNFTTIESNLNKYIKDRKKSLEVNREKYTKLIKIQKSLENIPNITSTPFVQDHKKVIVIYEATDIYEFFNSIVLSDTIPFAKLVSGSNSIYKTYNSFQPSSYEFQDNTITLLYKGETSRKITPIKITFSKNIEIEYDIYLDNEETVFNNITAAIDNRQAVSKNYKNIYGSFAIIDINIDRDVFLELLMNYYPAYDIMHVDESINIAASKPKKGGEIDTNIRVIYDSIAFSLSFKKTGINDVFYQQGIIKNRNKDYWNVRIENADSLFNIEAYRNIFLAIIGLYINRFEDIKEVYEQIPKFSEKTYKTSVVKRQLSALQEYAPEIFDVERISKLVQGKRQPLIYDPKIHKTFFQYENLRFTCPEEYPVAGLIENNLSNKDSYPYIPHCYPAGKTNKKTSNTLWLESYLKGGFEAIDSDKKVKTSGNLVDKKAVGYNKKGKLPRNLQYILNEEAYRTGTPFDSNSFLHAVLLAVDKEYKNKQNKEEYVRDVRRNSFDTLDTEFDSKIFIKKLEYIYNSSIYVFSTLEDINATFEIPDFNEVYIKGIYSKSILIFKHMGTAADHLKQPHYELIVADKESIVDNSSELGKRILDFYNRVYNYTEIGVKISSKKLKYDNQYIDSYDNVRSVSFGKIPMLVSPLAIKHIGNNYPDKLDKISPVDLSDAKKFIAANKLKIVAKNVMDGKLVGIKTDAYDYSYIPIIPTDDSLEELPLNVSLESSVASTVLKKTFHNRKIADFLVQFALHYYESGEDIEEYVNSFIVDESHVYEIPEREISKNNSFFDDSGNLIIDSEKTRKKLSWIIYFYSKERKIENSRYLDNYYTIPEDFKQQLEVSIVFGDKTVKKDHKIYAVETLDATTKEPQFFSTWVFGGIILVQNTKDKETAIAVSHNFMKNGYNAGYEFVGESPAIFNEVYTKNGLLIVENFNEKAPTIYRYGESYAAFLFV